MSLTSKPFLEDLSLAWKNPEGELHSSSLYDAAYSGIERGIEKLSSKIRTKIYGEALDVVDFNDPIAGKKEAYKGGGDFSESVVVDGRRREFLLHVPKGYDGTKPLPLVVMLHGHGGSDKQIAELTKMSEKADKEGFIVAYPNATDWLGSSGLRAWDSDNGLVPPGFHSNDVAFIGKVIGHGESTLNVDAKRIHLVGYSNGGMMTFKTAAELSDKVASFAVVAAAMSGKEEAPSSPISVLSIGGSSDGVVPPFGLMACEGLMTLGLPRFEPDTYASHFWKTSIGADEFTEEAFGEKVLVENFKNVNNGADVRRITISGGDHEWPGSDRRRRPGDPDGEFSATDEIWAFLQSHPKVDSRIGLQFNSPVNRQINQQIRF